MADLDHSSPAAAGEAGVSGVRQWRSEMAGYSNREEVPAQHSVLPCMIVSLQFA